MKKTNSSWTNRPVAYISKGKQRVKQFNDTVYLKNGDNFEIELFNPTEFKILAKIKLNNVSIGSGIILRPGERVFLERYLNEAKKFLFETYNVNGNNSEVLKAIESNGDVIVEFFKEQQVEIVISKNITWQQPNIFYNDFVSNRDNIWTSCDNYITSNLYSHNLDLNGSVTCSGTLTTSNYPSDFTCCDSLSKESIETGRVEKGDYSSQKFVYDTSNFESYSTWKSEWKILPESRKAVNSSDLLIYCSGCGRRQKQNENFCPKCGRKF